MLSDYPISQFDNKLILQIAKSVAKKNNIKFKNQYIALSKDSKVESCLIEGMTVFASDIDTGLTFIFPNNYNNSFFDKLKNIFFKKELK